MKVVTAVLAVIFAVGCGAASDVSSDDMSSVRNDFSQDKYEKAMIAAGKGAELEREKAAAAERGEGQ